VPLGDPEHHVPVIGVYHLFGTQTGLLGLISPILWVIQQPVRHFRIALLVQPFELGGIREVALCGRKVAACKQQPRLTSLSPTAWDPFRAGASPRNLHTGSHCGLAIEPDNLRGSIKLTMSRREIMTS
jgi:hypothetical protein